MCGRVLVFLGLLGCVIGGASNGGARCSTLSDCGKGASGCADSGCTCYSGYTCRKCSEPCQGFASAETWVRGQCTNACTQDVADGVATSGSDSNQSNNNPPKRSSGEITGIVFAVLISFFIIFAFIWYMMRDKTSNAETSTGNKSAVASRVDVRPISPVTTARPLSPVTEVSAATMMTQQYGSEFANYPPLDPQMISVRPLSPMPGQGYSVPTTSSIMSSRVGSPVPGAFMPHQPAFAPPQQAFVQSQQYMPQQLQRPGSAMGEPVQYFGGPYRPRMGMLSDEMMMHPHDAMRAMSPRPDMQYQYDAMRAMSPRPDVQQGFHPQGGMVMGGGGEAPMSMHDNRVMSPRNLASPVPSSFHSSHGGDSFHSVPIDHAGRPLQPMMGYNDPHAMNYHQ